MSATTGSLVRMHILITGAGGFIGRRLADALRAEGHTVIAARRSPGTFARDGRCRLHARSLPIQLGAEATGVDIVINAVGILREQGAQTFERVHVLAPQALFAACAAVGVRRVVQISALGAVGGTSGYFRSKRQRR